MKRFVLALTVVGLVCLGARADAADERTATDGKRSLAVSSVRDLNPDGEVVEVKGSGYDQNKGIYVAFCLIPPKGERPSPCAGGEDRDGASGSSVWLSPRVADQGLGAKAFGPNGSFTLRIVVKAVINENIDCRKARCAVVTRNDHFATDDRSQDLFVPITFRATSATTAPPAGAPTPTTLAPPVLPPTTTTTLPTAFAAPNATIAEDRLSVSGGGKTLRASDTSDLRAGDEVEVTGEGYDTARGVYVSLCAVPAPGATPGPCASGSAGAQAWISSNPPDFGKGIAKPYGTGGTFVASLTLNPVIDGEHDCREISCAVATRNDDTHLSDRSQDLLLPVAFALGKTEEVAVDEDTVVSPNEENQVPWRLILGVPALLITGGIAAMRRRKTAA